jgi:hypothetical protein
MSDATSDEPVPGIRRFDSGWSLIEMGTWQISVAPDGLLMLPRHLHPDEVDDFCATARAAAVVGRETIEANTARTTPQPTGGELADPGPILTETGREPPEGSVKMVVTPRTGSQRDASAIGRPKRTDPRQPTIQQANHPLVGGRHGRP